MTDTPPPDPKPQPAPTLAEVEALARNAERAVEAFRSIVPNLEKSDE